MAVQGATTTYDEPIGTGTNREDLSNMLWDVTPLETPGVTACGKGTSTAVSHDWPTDRLEDASTNSATEGADADPQKAAARTRLDNKTQILTKDAVVSGTQEKVLKGGGIKSEMAYQVARRMKAIKRDLEKIVFGTDQSKAAGDLTGSNNRLMGSFYSYMAGTSWQGGAGAVAPDGNGLMGSFAAGTDRAITEDIMKDGLSQLWEQSGGNENILGICGKHVRGQISNFTASSTRYVTTDDKKLVASIDVYDGDFHTVTISPDRFSDPSRLVLFDKEYAKIADMRPLFTQDLSKTGDNYKKQLIWETTVEVCDPLAHVVIADLLTA